MKPKSKSLRLDRGNLRDLVVVLAVGSVFFFPLPTATLAVGWTLMFLGCSLHVLVKGQLIRNRVLCTRGAYGMVRHPYYLANYLIDTGICLLSGNIFLAALYPFLFFFAYGPTFREEEARLASLHGRRFAAWRDTTPQVFPESLGLGRCKRLASGFSWRRVTAKEIKRLARFGFLAVLLPLLHHLHGMDWNASRLVRRPIDGVGLAMFVACAVFLTAAALIPQHRNEADDLGEEKNGDAETPVC